MKGSIVALLCVAAAAVAMKLPRLKRDVGAKTYLLPAGVDLIIGPIKSTFSCEDRNYGYYADVDNDCHIFHVCVPITDENNDVQDFIYSFACGNQTVFDQQNLVCVHKEDFTECNESVHVYDKVNSRFGVVERSR